MTLGEESIAFVRFACVAAAFCLPRSEHLAKACCKTQGPTP